MKTTAPWRLRRQWASGRIRAIPAEIYAALWFAVAAAFLLDARLFLGSANLVDELRRWDDISYAIVGFIAAAVVMAALGVTYVAHAVRFGRPVFVCAKVPYAPGELLEGWIELKPQPAQSRVTVSVYCIRSWGESEVLVWGDEQIETAGSGRTHVSMQLPDDLPGTFRYSIRRANPVYHWFVSARAGTWPLGLRAVFEVPVIGEALRAERHPATSEQKVHASAAGKGVIVVVGPKPWLFIVLVFFFAFGFISMGIYVTNPYWFLGFIFVGAGTAMTYVALDAAFGQSKIKIDGGAVTLHRRLMGSDRVRQIASNRIRALDIITEGLRPQMFWSVRLLLVSGDPIVAARYVTSKARAEAIQRRMQELLNRLD